MFMVKIRKGSISAVLSLLLLFIVSGWTETGTTWSAVVGTADGAGIGYAVGGVIVGLAGDAFGNHVVSQGNQKNDSRNRWISAW